MKYLSLILGLIILSSSHSWTQSNREDYVRCYTVEVEAKMRAKNTQMESISEFESWMATQLAKKGKEQQAQKTMVVKTIPTVVHVIYSNAGENISDAQVLSQIDILNDDFRRTNADAVNTPAAFLGVAVDSEIEFCMAQQDPNGGPTNGINRVSMAGSPFSDTYVDGTIKPSTVWDANDYFNIWVANLDGGLLGWAQFPNSSGLSGMNANNGGANTDGVVLLHASVGAPPANPFPGPYNLGRTATHEVGHWIGLRHIWGDAACGTDDFCPDTPDSDASNFGCPTNHVSCSTTDMIENYMDYTDDACMNLFTQDQKSRMEIVLNLSPRRASLLTSGKCQAATVPPVAAFTSDNATICPGTIVNFFDQSTAGATSWSWTFTGGTPATSTAQNPTVTYSTPGIYTVSLTATNGFGSNMNTQNAYINVSSTNTEIIFGEDFESNTFTQNNWTIDNPDGLNTWLIAPTTGNSGSYAGYVDCYDNNFPGARDAIISPVIDLTNHQNIMLDFEHAHRRYSVNEADSLIVYLSTNGGSTWPNKLYAQGENGAYNFATGGLSNPSFFPAATDDWCGQGSPSASCTSISLAAFMGQSNVKIKFEVYNDYGNNIFVDNIYVTGQCLAMVAPVADFNSSETSGCAPFSVSFADLSLNSPNTWNWTFTGPAGIPASSSQNPTITFTTPGTYSVNLQATNGVGSDTENKPSFITVHPSPSVTIGSSMDESCGLGNGTATASGTGGTGSLNYLWNTTPTQNTPTAGGLSAGLYTVTVTDANSCTAIDDITLINTPGPAVTTSGIDPSCTGNDGSITATATGGTLPHTYSWNTTPVSTTATVTGLGAGTYIVDVTDQAGCTTSMTHVLSNAASPSVSMAQSDDVCASGIGSATATASGGAGNYTYSWNTTPVQTGMTATGLTAGTYSVTVTDAGGCTTTGVSMVGNEAGPGLIVSSIADAECGGNNGQIVMIASGGTPSYTYIWNTVPVQTGPMAAGLTPGTYTVTVTDATGCTSISTQTVMNIPGPSSIMGSVTDETCSLGNGTAQVTANGNGPFNYLWNTSPIQANPEAINLSAGIYEVTVTDINGCTTTNTATVSNSPGPVLTTTVSNSNCGVADGSATVGISGGTLPYTYLWGTSPFQSTSTAINLSAGTYGVTVTDGASCVSSTTAAVGSINGPITSVSGVTASNCNAPTGSATVSHTGGTGNVFYAWSSSPPQTGATATSLAPGLYSVSATDDNGCVGISEVTIDELPSPILSVTAQSDESCGSGNGSVTVLGSGGSGSLTYSWSNFQSGPMATGLSSGIVNCTVTDASGCSDIVGVNLGNAPGPVANINSFTNSTCNMNNGQAILTIGSGTFPFNISWSTTPGQTGYVATGLSAGSYTVTVTDDNGCVGQGNVMIQESGSPSSTITSQSDAICGGNSGSASLQINGGLTPYVYDWGTNPAINGPDANFLGGGTYTVTITDDNDCQTEQIVEIGDSPGPDATIVNSSGDVCESGVGSAEVLATGGTAPLTYLWNSIPSQAGIIANNLSSGSYTVTVTDANGCISTQSVSISSSPALVASITNSSDALCGVDNGTATVGVATGVPPYSFAWNTVPVQTTPFVSGLGGGNYGVTVTDQFGCESMTSVTIGTSDAPTVSIANSTDVICNGQNNGTATATGSGGTSPYTYNWNTSPSQSTPLAVGLAPGTYSVEVEDASGCTSIATVDITEPAEFLMDITSTAPTAGNNDGQATADVTGGSQPYSYLWSNGSTTQSVNDLASGPFSVTVTDANGCQVTDESNFAVGVHSLQPGEIIKLYPNPTKGMVTLDIKLNESQNLWIKVYNNLGQEVYGLDQREVSTSQIPLQLEGLAKGVYQVKVFNDELQFVEKLILIGQ